MPTFPHIAGDLRIFALISRSPAFYRNLQHYSTIIGNIGDMMRGDEKTLTFDTIKVLAPKESPAAWTSGVGISELRWAETIYW